MLLVGAAEACRLLHLMSSRAELIGKKTDFWPLFPDCMSQALIEVAGNILFAVVAGNDSC